MFIRQSKRVSKLVVSRSGKSKRFTITLRSYHGFNQFSWFIDAKDAARIERFRPS